MLRGETLCRPNTKLSCGIQRHGVYAKMVYGLVSCVLVSYTRHKSVAVVLFTLY